MTKQFTAEETGRRYFETEKQAENFLIEQGYAQANPSSRYPWSSRNGLIDADIRFNTQGIFIEYRA